ncbi:stage II sporulation protein R [Halalkalibacter sp. APA_J-10(15)]|uniref:stage II sporulation protein R n=1 Tax=Halalkalibacter sp. APA_J-10(15) TaxID=2933805 RepID=UPI001FF501BD|nr:stage II sporulation protein R [Halalkalibacter sp. APA_J-10(15)]MCK0470030.1 stage II sporulation protein R [Halalkalibacter sp. APA_J-10(15)]
MKPNVVIYLLFSLFVIVVNWEAQHSLAIAELHQEVNEEEAIRLRILANSDSVADQALKRDIRDRVNEAITEWVLHIDDMEEAKATIEANLVEIEKIVAQELERYGLEQGYEVDFDAVNFPTKLYGHLVYPAGIYDAVLITLGKGNGENWWCVLFPPLCFIDMANGDAIETTDDEFEEEIAEETDEEEIEVSFFFVEWFSGLFERIFG